MRVCELDGEFGLDNLRLLEREVPVPGPTDVLVKINAASLNFRDFLMVSGQYNPRQPLPLVPLSDGAGEVVAVGERVDRFQVGDRVIAQFAQRWIAGPPEHHRIRSSTLGGPLDGMAREYALFDQQGLVATPAHLTDAQAATLPCAALTAWSALTAHTPLLPGQILLVQGTGGVALFALQFGKLLGATVIVTSSSDEKLERAKALGADHLINYRSEPDWDRQARRLTDNVGVDRVIEVGGGGTFDRSLRATRMGGMIATIGVLAGVSGPINILPILMSSLTVQGIQVGNRDDFESMNRAITGHQLVPVIGAEYELAEIRTAFETMKHASHYGKIVIEISR